MMQNLLAERGNCYHILVTLLCHHNGEKCSMATTHVVLENLGDKFETWVLKKIRKYLLTAGCQEHFKSSDSQLAADLKYS